MPPAVPTPEQEPAKQPEPVQRLKPPTPAAGKGIRIEPGPKRIDLDKVDLRPAKERLKSFAERLRTRAQDIAELFKGDAHDPTKSKAYQKFLLDQASEVAMRYVLVGVVHATDEVSDPKQLKELSPEDRERLMKTQGFVVSGEPVHQLENETSDTASVAPPHSDETLMSSQIGELARTLGFDPNGDDE